MTSPLSMADGGRSINYAPGQIATLDAAWTYSGDNGTKATVVTDLDRAGGGFSLTLDGTDNDCETVHHGGEVVDPTSVGNHFGFEAVILGTEISTDNANWFVGFSDVVGATFFGDTGTLASMDAFGIYKVEGSLFFRSCALNAAAQSGSTTTTAFASATEYRIRVEGETGTTGITARFYVNDVLIDTVTGMTATDTGLMHSVVALAAGGADAEVFELRSFTPYSIPA